MATKKMTMGLIVGNRGFFPDSLAKSGREEMLRALEAAGTVGKENTFGTRVGLIKPEKMSFARFSTDDSAGKMRGYVGEGKFTDDPLNTFGSAGVVEISEMQKLLRFICEKGFEHHVAANLSSVAASVHEATTRYLGWDTHWHEAPGGAC